MNIPLIKIIENITDDLFESESRAFSDTITAAAHEKNLSVIHWQFLGSELRELPKKLPKNIQSLVDEMCAGMDQLAAGEHWADTSPTFDKVYDMFHKEWVSIAPHVMKTIHALKNTADSIRAVSENTEAVYAAAGYAICEVSSAACSAAYDASFDVETWKAAQADEEFNELAIQAATEKAGISYVEARQRQRDKLLELVKSAPILEDIQRAKAAVEATYTAYQEAENAYVAEEKEALGAFDGCASHYASLYESAKIFDNEAKAAKAAYEAADHYFQLILGRNL